MSGGGSERSRPERGGAGMTAGESARGGAGSGDCEQNRGVGIRDAGLAAERTALAWRRTAVSAMVVAALLLNHAATSGWRAAAVAPIGAAVTMAAVAGMCFVRNTGLRHGRHGRGGAAVAATAVAVLGVSIVALALGITDPQP